MKLVALLELSRIGLTHRQNRAWTYRVVEWTGRWSMMDVLLLALLVTLVKLGDLVSPFNWDLRSLLLFYVLS